jgi:hypothetical protein
MKKLLVICSLLFALQSNAQFFGDKCAGKWRGIMQIFSYGKLKDTVSVVLTVKKINDTAWSWKTEYLSAKMPITKDYVLRLTNKDKAHYITDEGEGVILSDYLVDNRLYSVFETEGVMLTSYYELKGNQLAFEVTSGKKVGEPQGGVTGYSTDFVQKVVFRKQK